MKNISFEYSDIRLPREVQLRRMRAVMENELTCNFKLASGSGLLVTGGTSRPMTYTCTADKLAFREEDGTELAVSPGKTYICLVNSKLKSKTALA